MKTKIKDLSIALAVIVGVVLISFLAYLLAYYFAIPSERIQNGLAALTGSFMVQLVLLMFYAVSK